MFNRRTIRAQTPVSHVDTPEEALALSIGERARVDIAYMAALTGMEEAALIQQLQAISTGTWAALILRIWTGRPLTSAAFPFLRRTHTFPAMCAISCGRQTPCWRV